ncbi:MAG: hypoxanthine phosphoribosyltransferase [Candidatus Izemoplasmatales bacterium]
MLDKDIDRVLLSETEIIKIAKRLGKQITKDYQGKKPVFIGLLKGCLPFLAELMKYIDLYCEIELMGVQSYHGGTESTGNVKITKDLDVPVDDRDVIMVEDIVDTGRTITGVINLLKYRGAASVEVVTLLDKPEGRVKELIPKYIGTKIPKEFVVGYGLDYKEFYRNLPYVGILKKSVYTKKL